MSGTVHIKSNKGTEYVKWTSLNNTGRAESRIAVAIGQSVRFRFASVDEPSIDRIGGLSCSLV